MNPARLAVPLLAIAVLAAAPAQRRADVRMAATRGALGLVNSRDGRAVFEARNMKPGDTAAGAVTIENRGTSSGRLYLRSSAPRGSLRDVLRVRIAEGRTSLAEGFLAELAGCHDLGVVRAGAKRTFRFSASWQAGSADNAYAGSSVVVDERWVANGCLPAQEAPPRLVLSHRRVSLVHGRAKLKVRCRGSGTCAGTIHLRARNDLRTRLSAAAVTRFRVGGRRQGQLYLRVPAASRAALRKRRKAIALAVVNPGGVTRMITLIHESANAPDSGK